MPSNPERSQPLTDEDVRAINGRRRGAVQSLNGCDCMQPNTHGVVLDSLGDVPRLLAEIDRLQSELEDWKELVREGERIGMQNVRQLDERAAEAARLRAHLEYFRTLEDRIPDGSNGDRMLGWDKGWNAAYSGVRKTASLMLSLDQSGEGQANG